MNERELTQVIHKEYGFSKSLSERILKKILGTIAGELAKNTRVRLRNFGTFEIRKSRGAPRVKFNPSKNLLSP